MPRPSPEEKADRKRVRKDLWKEVDRLYKRTEVLEFIERNCERVSVESGGYVFDTYDYIGRNRRPKQIALRQLIRDNLSNSIKNDKTPNAWEGVEDKIAAIELGLLYIPVPLDEKAKRKENARAAKATKSKKPR